jgi:hypothetical protein
MTKIPLTVRASSAVGSPATVPTSGIYQGSVVSVSDPLVQNRVTLSVPQILGTAVSNWALPVGDSSLFGPVVVGQIVHVAFLGGNKNLPVYAPLIWPAAANMTVTGNLVVNGTSALHGLVTASNGLTVSAGASTLSGGVTVTGGATIDIINQSLKVFKPNDTTRSNTSVTSDPDLSLTLAANAVYTFDLELYVSGSGTGAIQYQFSKPFSGTAGTYSATQYNLSGGFQNVLSNLSTNNTASVNSPNTSGIMLKGVVDNTGQASGTFVFQWAQNTNNGSTTVGQYSYMKLERMA